MALVTLTSAWSEIADETAAGVALAHLRGDRVEIVFTAAEPPAKRLPFATTRHFLERRSTLDLTGMDAAGVKTFARSRGWRALIDVGTATGSAAASVAAAGEGVAGVARAAPIVADLEAGTLGTRLLTVPAPGLLRGARNIDRFQTRAALTVSAVAGGSVGTPFALLSGAIFHAKADGAFTYDPRPAFGSVAAGKVATETVAFTVANGAATTGATLTVKVRGTGGLPRSSLRQAPAFSPAFSNDFKGGI